MNNTRCAVWVAVLLACVGCASIAPERAGHSPILFVHGSNGDASRWMTTLWRFESNGWPRDRLFAMDVVHPFSAPEYDKPHERRSTAAEHRAQIGAEVDRVLKATGAEKVILVANSRGGWGARDYIRNGGGSAKVSHAVLGGTPNHGIWNSAEFQPRAEPNGAGPFLTALNSAQGPGGLEVTPGVAFMTIRSDTLDLWTQPDGKWLGKPGFRTNVTHASVELKGAENVVLPGADHLEVSYGPEAFARTYRFITGRMPSTTAIVPETPIVLDGMVSVSTAGATNLPASGATVEVYEVACATGERRGPAVHVKVTASNGRWGPFKGSPAACYEFVGWADGTARNHVYRTPFPRSSSVVHIRLIGLSDADRKAQSVVQMVRPRGLFALRRAAISLDGKDPPGVEAGVPGVNVATLRLQEHQIRSVVAEYRSERISVRSWPVRENRTVRAEFHY